MVTLFTDFVRCRKLMLRKCVLLFAWEMQQPRRMCNWMR